MIMCLNPDGLTEDQEREGFTQATIAVDSFTWLGPKEWIILKDILDRKLYLSKSPEA